MFLKVFLSVIKIKYHIYLGMILTKINSIHLIFARFHIKYKRGLKVLKSDSNKRSCSLTLEYLQAEDLF